MRRIEDMAPAALADRLARQTDPALILFDESWTDWAHDGQRPPPGDWRVWLMLAGRGFGKTRAGAELVSELARRDGAMRIALVGATLDEVAAVMVTGASGLIAVARAGEDVAWYPSRGLIEFASGARAFAYSGANPESLRGPEHHFAWCDELAKWAYPEAAWDNLMLGLRLGRGARALATTTPRPIPLLQRLIADGDTVVTHGRTADNPHLPGDFVAAMTRRYGGTRLGRQELDGLLIGEADGALWTRALIERCRTGSFLAGTGGWPAGRAERVAPMPAPPLHHSASPSGPHWQVDRAPGTILDCRGQPNLPIRTGEELRRVVIGVDPPARAGGDECGIVVCGIDADGIGHVLDDRSAGGLSPEGWARAVVAAAEAWGAERVVVETNQGGDMVEAVLRGVDCALPVRGVTARFGKGLRAEPVALRFEAGKARFAGGFPELEDQLCGMTVAGYEGPGRSPDRADAMVWAIAELLLGKERVPQVRGL